MSNEEGHRESKHSGLLDPAMENGIWQEATRGVTATGSRVGSCGKPRWADRAAW